MRDCKQALMSVNVIVVREAHDTAKKFANVWRAINLQNEPLLLESFGSSEPLTSGAWSTVQGLQSHRQDRSSRGEGNQEWRERHQR